MSVTNRVYNYHITLIGGGREYLIDFTNRYGETIDQFYYYGPYDEAQAWAESKIGAAEHSIVYA